jgi:hypothetical protein
MNAISLWQPWASAMPAGLKLIETRGRPVVSPHLFGPVAIHAAAKWTADQEAFWEKHVAAPHCVNSLFAFRNIGIVNRQFLSRGMIIAVGELYGCRRTEDLVASGILTDLEKEWGNYAPGRFGWLFRNIIHLPTPIPYPGRQGWFRWVGQSEQNFVIRHPELFTLKP